MADLPMLDAKNVRELHLLPRVIFSVGGIILVGGFYIHSATYVFGGLACIFAGVGLNLAVDVWNSTAQKRWWWGIVQSIFCFLTASMFAILAFLLFSGVTFYHAYIP